MNCVAAVEERKREEAGIVALFPAIPLATLRSEPNFQLRNLQPAPYDHLSYILDAIKIPQLFTRYLLRAALREELWYKDYRTFPKGHSQSRCRARKKTKQTFYDPRRHLLQG